MKQRISFLLLFLLLFLSVLSAYGAGNELDGLEVRGKLTVHSISSESYLRDAGEDLSCLGQDEYITIEFLITNTGTANYQVGRSYCRIDNGEELAWQGYCISPGTTINCHVYHVNMAKLAPGQHRFDLYVNNALAYTGYFDVGRAWNSIMRLPSEGQVKASDSVSTARSPYVVYYPQFLYTEVITEYSVDFCIDDLPGGTYFSTLNANMGIASLQEKYNAVTNDYSSPGGFYCGFQRWEDGQTAVIMSVWDLFCSNSEGNRTTICATQLYPQYKEGVSETSIEGSFQQFIIKYD